MLKIFKLLKITCLTCLLLSFYTYAGDVKQYFSKEFFKSDGIQNTDVVVIESQSGFKYEHYARGYKKDTKHLSWSMAKTISGILIAIAIQEKKLSLDDKVSDHYPAFKGSATIRDVLQMSSGIKFEETYFGIPVTADVTKMLYLKGPKEGMANYTLGLELRDQKPGEHYYYSSGDTNVLMGVLQNVMTPFEYENYPWTRFFDHLNINATFERDSRGIFVGSSYMYMSAEDYLKVGRLLMNKGSHQGKQIIPSWYFAMMTEVAPGVISNSYNPKNKRAYSMQLHINKSISGQEREFPMLPEDAFMMLGHQGQMIITSPSEKFIILRLGTDKKRIIKQRFFYQATKSFYEAEGYQRPKNWSAYRKKPKSVSLWDIELKDVFKVPKLITAVAAKEICSCHFVVKRSVGRCRKDIGIKLPFHPFLQAKGKEVRAYFPLGSSSKAIYKGEKYGCTLVE